MKNIRSIAVLMMVAAVAMAGCAEETSDSDPTLGGIAGENGNGGDGNVTDNSNGTVVDNSNGTVTDNSNGTVTNALAGEVRGVVFDVLGNFVDGAQIQLKGPSYDMTVTTDTNGSFSIPDVPYGELKLEINHNNFSTIRRAMEHSADSAGFPFEFVTKRVTVTELNSEEGGVVEIDGAKIGLPAGGYISDVTGEPVQGFLQVRTAYFDANNDADLAAAPPLYRVLDEASGNILISYGMVDVELFINDESVDLGPGARATLDLPVEGHLAALEGVESVPAWWYDTEAGTWVREGEGRVVPTDDGLRWRAEVSHFTVWNCDDPGFGDCNNVGRCGSDVGECRSGRWACDLNGSQMIIYDGQGGQAAICDGAVGPVGETCDRKDNNCNGQTDESFPGKGDDCWTGPADARGVGACSDGYTSCDGPGAALDGFLTCDGQVLPESEECDGIDADCDGIDDKEDEDACPIGYSCFEGTEGWSCQPF